MEPILQQRLTEERRRIAQQLHDTLSQSLTALYLHAKFLERKFAEIGPEPTADLQQLAERLHHSVRELHEIMHELQSAPLDGSPPREAPPPPAVAH